jgi:CheY-like chemotaxis protein/anti-sigma regulatory factor (Ser/Thr protein kinase)
MNGVIGMLELLLQEDVAPDQHRMVRTARDSAQALLQVLNDILDFSRIESGRLALESIPVDLAALAQDVITALSPSAAGKGLRIGFRSTPAEPPALLGDPARLRQILFNLLNNAIKFTSSRAESDPDIEIELGVTAQEEKAAVLLCVRDHGIGMDEPTQARLFQPFSQGDVTITRRFGGSGLGLSICKHLVDLMDGRITVHSEPGAGSEFCVHLDLPRASEQPAVAAPATTPPVRQPLQAPAGAEAGGRLILYVEDNAVNQQVGQRQLAWLGHACLVAGNGVEALALWQRHHFGLVLTDVQMPEMDGIALTRRLRQLEAERGLPRTPVIALTASAMPGELERCQEAGMDDFLAKPLELEVLQRCLEKWLPADQREPVVDD